MQATPDDQNQFVTKVAQLTRTQKQVLRLFLSGQDDGAIAVDLEIKDSTVRQHISRIANKLGVPSDKTDKGFRRRELVKQFRQFGIDGYTVADIHYCDEPAVPKVKDSAVEAEVEPKQAWQNDPNFVGREEAIAELDRLRKQGSKLVQIVAAGGQGKTTLARKYLYSRFDHVIEFAIAKETKDIASVQSLLEEKLRQIGKEPGRELMVSLERFKQHLQSKKIGILIDNLEPALDATGKFIGEYRSYVELLRTLNHCSLKSYSIITSRELLNESSISSDVYKLKGLKLEAWQKYFEYQSLIFLKEGKSLMEMHKSFGGNAKAMDVFSGVIKEDCEGKLENYWNSNRNFLLLEPTLENLVKEQFNRLLKLNLIDSYNLICRMGCYRYQDVSTIQKKGVIDLLWDTNETESEKAIKILKDRGLLESKQEKYWLHPIVREEAIQRLRVSSDWIKTNIKAAESWSKQFEKSDNEKDIISSFEAYYHYLSIEEFDQAAKTISRTKERANKSRFSFWTLLYQIGRLQQIKDSIYRLIDTQGISYELARLHDILGDLCLMSGEINAAKNSYQKCSLIAKKLDEQECFFNSDWFSSKGNLRVTSIFNMGLCLVFQWNLSSAIKYFEDVVFLTKSLNSDLRCHNNALVILCFLYSQLNENAKSQEYMKKYSSRFPDYNKSFWSIGHSYIFHGKACQNLKKKGESMESYLKALEFSKKVEYPRIQGQALVGIAELKRINLKYGSALIQHQDSVEIFKKIGGKCDLAEAYLQYALTYQSIRDKGNSQKYFDKALYLWSPEQINAPKQIERVRKVMNQSL
ncbi:LuxR C-terminal-related transcriptional regulator [[Limnothrix rosea] IAM M-220]|uniref:LuxR C-terminal-related transcriptional regulator n=1 Tax=[Limnothrix rosea] IAM M-220 TaxID=454133 RepID=UPI0009655BE1|nr:LuxR C-terminal-related transcriptional regulator [[Limnothrix rosea] IAM M-220]OKH17126.1 hypothetical protein NIES208_10605 [[Limnothrix rosea] IAM M-220]